jgi:hypothetical protein
MCRTHTDHVKHGSANESQLVLLSGGRLDNSEATLKRNQWEDAAYRIVEPLTCLIDTARLASLPGVICKFTSMTPRKIAVSECEFPFDTWESVAVGITTDLQV